jgi:tRNA A-37 threonylcarbamoyl transferase component Bud32
MSHNTGRLPPRTMLNGRYIIVRTVDKGGMGAVYEATDTMTGHRRVAVKEMSQSKLDAHQLAAAQQRFRQEAEMLSHLSHPRLPRVYDFFSESGRSYLVMEFINGETLQKKLDRSPNHRLPVGMVIDYAQQLCEVLSYLHRQSWPIIFRDLKPSNVMVTANNQVYLIDFGIARLFNGRADTEQLGTPGYSPPEQHTGSTTPLSDLYSLGATLHYCLTGHNPKDNQPQFHFLPVHNYSVQVPAQLDELVLRLVAYRERDRPQSTEAVLHQLRQIRQNAASGTVDMNVATGNTGTNPQPLHQAPTVPMMSASELVHTLMVWCARCLEQLRDWYRTDAALAIAQSYQQCMTWLSLVAQPFLYAQYQQGKRHIRSLAAADQPGRFIRGLLSNLAPRMWTPYFTTLFLLLVPLVLVVILYTIARMHWAPHQVALDLCLVLALYAFSCIFHKAIHHVLVRNSLIVITAAMLLMLIALQSFPDAKLIAHALTLAQVCAWLIVVGAIITLLSPTNRLYWLERGIIALVAGSCALLLAGSNPQEWQQFGLVSQEQATNATLLVMVVLLALVALSGTRLRNEPAWLDRFLVFVLALIVAGMQWVFGLPIIAHAAITKLFGTTPLIIAMLHIVLTILPVVIALFCLFRQAVPLRLHRISLLVLALVYVPLLGAQTVIPVFLFSPLYPDPLRMPLYTLLSISNLALYGLIALVLLLLVRGVMFMRFTRVDRLILFGMVLDYALLLWAIWSNDIAGQSIQGVQDVVQAASHFQLLAVQGLIMLILGIFIVVYLVTFTISVLLSLAHHSFKRRITMQPIPHLENLVSRLERATLLTATVVCIFFLLRYGQDELLLAVTFLVQGVPITLYEIALGTAIVEGIMALWRVSRPFGRWDRLLMLIDALVCGLLLWSAQYSTATYDLPSITAGMNLPQLVLPQPALFSSLGLAIAALVSLVWQRLPYPARERRLLLVISGLLCACTLLQLFSSAFLFLALVLLAQGMMLATRMEMVYGGASNAVHP